MLFSSRMSGNIGILSGSNTGVVSTGSTVVAKSAITQQTSSGLQGNGLLVTGVILGIVIGRLIAKLLYVQNRSVDRKLAVQQSKATTLGYVSEKIAPLLPDFPYSYKDLVFLGKGVDYICFDGLSEGSVKQVVFLEIKTGKSMLNKNELLIKSAIDAGKVHWETVRI